MHYYEFSFAASDELLEQGWYTCEDWDDTLSQAFYGKSETALKTHEQAREYLLATFPVTTEYNVNLVNCIDEHTAGQLCYFCEISAEEFESCCGCKA